MTFNQERINGRKQRKRCSCGYTLWIQLIIGTLLNTSWLEVAIFIDEETV